MELTSNQKMFFGFILVIVLIAALIILIVFLSKPKTPEYYSDNESKGILSFTGGGMRALTTDVGVIHGIRRRLAGRLTLNQFLDRYQVISACSGGSWFSSLMIYSPSFFKMLAEGELTTFDKDCNGNPVPGSEKWKMACGTKNMNKCGVNNKQCCCEYGYKFNDNNWFDKCDLCYPLKPDIGGQFTFEEYIARALQVIRTKTANDSFINTMINFLPDSIGGNYIKPFLYFYNEPWAVISQEIIFDPVGDMSRMVANNPNNITSHCVWGSVILQDSNLVGNTGYYIGTSENNRSICTSNTTVNDCGVMVPITFDYDHSKKSSTMGLYGGTFQSSVPITYYDGANNINTNMIQKYLSRTTSSVISPSDIAGCSSATAAIAAQTKVLDTAVENAIGDGFFKNYIKEGLQWLLEKVSRSFNDLAIPMMLNNSKNNIEIVPKHIDLPASTLSSNLYVRVGDGGFYDNSSITNALRAWQKDGGEGTCKIININPPHSMPSFQSNAKNTKTNAAIFNLFGCLGNDNSTRSCVSPTPGHMSKIDSPAALSDVIPFLVPQIFPMQDFYNERCLWWGRCSRDNSRSCSDDAPKCIVEIGITFYRTTTIQNNATGIIAGTPVELYVINVNSTKAEEMIMPGTNDTSSGLGYLNTAVKTSDLIQKIPEQLFNIMFLDQGDINTYSGDCGTVPKC